MSNPEGQPRRRGNRGRNQLPEAPAPEVLRRGRETLHAVTDIFSMETLGALHGTLRLGEEILLSGVTPGEKLRQVSSGDIGDLQRTLGILSRWGEFPTDLNRGEIQQALNTRKQALAQQEAEQARIRAEQEAQEKKRQTALAAERIKAAEKKKKRRKKGRRFFQGVAATVFVAVSAGGGIVAYDSYTASERRKQIAYEQTHTLDGEPSEYSYKGWRVRYPEVALGTKFTVIPDDQVALDAAEENKPIILREGDVATDTGLTFEVYARSDKKRVPRINVAFEKPKEDGYKHQEKILTTPNNPGVVNSRVILIENTDGKKLYVAVYEKKDPDSDKRIFVLFPVDPVQAAS